MGINIEVAGDENSCRAAAKSLTSISQGIQSGGTSFHTALSESEATWQGTAGDAFRNRLQPIGQSVDNIASHAQTAAQALNNFADDLTTVKSRMNQARSIATSAGLTVNGNTIEQPTAPAPVQGPTASGGSAAMTPQAAQAQRSYQTQQQAYQQVQQTVNEARTIEANAHNTLGQQMSTWHTLAADAAEQSPWILGGLGTGAVGSAIDKADEWAEQAETRSSQAKVWQAVADRFNDPYYASQAARQAGVYETEASSFERMAASASHYTAGLRGTQIGNILKANMNNLAKLDGTLGKIAEKIPIVGAVAALGQTGYDIATDPDKSAGTVIKHVSADMGGFVAGTAATEGMLATAAAIGMAGGPATLIAVGVGVGVAYGVGEVVNHWPEIQHWGENTYNTVSNDVRSGVDNAAHAIGHFFSSVF
jgi:uncharacterized protein YukE